ncbi:hypothetical protein DB771_08080 [Burkholderia sp. AU29985]|nr:hypothetical protein XM57_22950 [Burkholderia cepacia]AYZ94172.1 hypothetical protein EGY28_03240 [Burkholderia dolosa]ETP62084.1 hypothetical protein BDSB_16815 [Burkholderia dolosa PC543]PRE43270.1 hypothetical protein C6P87_25030 [Burkholderia sp. AU12872]PUA77352.1 hypothetical protein DB771_08080 [Burkholderia sp. AU29985]
MPAHDARHRASGVSVLHEPASGSSDRSNRGARHANRKPAARLCGAPFHSSGKLRGARAVLPHIGACASAAAHAASRRIAT